MSGRQENGRSEPVGGDALERTQREAAQRLADGVAENLAGAEKQRRMLTSLAQRHAATIVETHADAFREKVDAMTKLAPALSRPEAYDALTEYATDWMQRWVLFLDVLRRSGNAFLEREDQPPRPVLAFDYDVVLDGRERARPVNYALLRIKPPAGYPPQRENGRPYIIVDPRAGHGGGIGGFKSDSEVGVALHDGHPVYFVVFRPTPEPEQTLADVCEAEAEFVKAVRGRHPHAPPPLLIGNCQGGWASMILAATHPDLVGPIVIAGAPLSYWAGEIGKNPLRYFGGLAGGAAPALLASDLGGGKFDGAGLVLNFEQLNPGATWWRKYYDLFANVDTKTDDFLRFDDWWSGFYFMNEKEIRWIVENLFIGNKLTRGEAVLDNGVRVDLNKINTPIVVFASFGDNITPPQQALNWIPDLFESVEEIRARGHVIIYTLHDTVGHLGIFVSAKIAAREHQEIASVVKMIESLAPGLYEMIITDTPEGREVAFEGRGVEDILAYDDGREEEVEFAAVAKLSEWATKTYELTMRPALRAMVSPELAKASVEMHPLRQRRVMFSDQNPMLAAVKGLADDARANRKPGAPDNPFVEFERLQAAMIEQSWNVYRDVRDAWIELSFHALYASPWMKALGEQDAPPPPSHDARTFPEVKAAVAHVEDGGYQEAIIRMLILMAHARGSVRRERLERANQLLHARPPFDTMPPERRVRLIHEQNLIVEFAPNEAVAALPKMLIDDVDRIRAISLVFEIAGPADEMDAATTQMFEQLQRTLLTYAPGWALANGAAGGAKGGGEGRPGIA